MSRAVAPSNVEELQGWLQDMIKQLAFTRLIAAVVALVARLRDLNTELTKQLAQLSRARPRSERLRAVEAQLALPWAMNSEPRNDGAAPMPEAPTTGSDRGDAPRTPKGRKGKHPGRQSFPKDLERVPQYNGVPPRLRLCPQCGIEMGRLGHTQCEYLDVIPARVVVVQRTDETLKCKLDDTIVSAPPPPRIVERGVLGNRLIIEATADKFLEHQPIERQCLRYARGGVEIAPQTLGRCVGAHLDLLAPLAHAIHDKTRGAGLMATDATGIRILDPQAPEGIRSGTMWGWTNALWVSFFYCASGDADGVKRFLGEDNYARTVQADGTNLLTFIERAGGKRPGCWSHARRGLVLCARSKDRVALKGVKLIAPLFAVERQSKDAGENAAQRLARRQVHSRPIIDAIFAWVEEQRAVIPPGTPLGKALGYLHRQRSRLVLFLEDGNIPLTNNRRERELRKLVLGRRNWLFTWGDDGGERIANILTIVSSCIAHGVNPREYLVVVTQALLERRPVAELLPDRIVVSHPNLCIPGFTAPELPD
ncbi:MAG TPA: IS66 family transposase [Polyangiaceae bacterium]